MRRILTTWLAVTTAVVVAGTLPASATKPERAADTADYTASVPYYSNLCGVPVTYRLAGRVDSTLFFDDSGSIAARPTRSRERR